MAEKRLFKEYYQLKKNPPNLSNHQILSLNPISNNSNPNNNDDSDSDDINIFEWESEIAKPTKSDNIYYYNGKWNLQISVSSSYPIQPPTIKFNNKTPINHPNINFKTGEICLDILKLENWSPAWNLTNLIMAILILIDNPEIDSPLNIDSANLFKFDKLAFESLIQYNIWKFNTLYLKDKDEFGVRENEINNDITDNTNTDKTDENTDEKTDKNTDDDNTDKDIADKDTDKDNLDECEDITYIKENLNNTIITGGYQDPYTKNTKNLINQTKKNSENSSNKDYKNKKHLISHKSPNFKIIHDVGEEVTKQFIAKVNEIGHLHHINHSSSSSLNSLNQNLSINPNNNSNNINDVNSINHTPRSSVDDSSSDDLDSVRKQVTKNVTKQVEKLCSKSTSPEINEHKKSTNNYHYHDDNDTYNESDSDCESDTDEYNNLIHQPINECKNDENIEKIKKQFLKQVDDKVNEVRKKQEEYQRKNSILLNNINECNEDD